jgi:hypothetical protein
MYADTPWISFVRKNSLHLRGKILAFVNSNARNFVSLHLVFYKGNFARTRARNFLLVIGVLQGIFMFLQGENSLQNPIFLVVWCCTFAFQCIDFIYL